MTKTPIWAQYEERLSRVTAYIHDHLDEDMDLNRLAEIACLSPYHWHRIYRAVYGETIAVTVKRVRLHRAAGYLAHTTMSVEEVGRTFETLFGWLGTRNLMGPETRAVGICYDDPEAVPEDKLRSRAGIVVTKGFPIEEPLDLTDIAGGEYAVLRYKGPYADMHAAYQWFFSEWLRKSGREAGDAPMFEEYLNNPRDTPPTELLTDICMPLN